MDGIITLKSKISSIGLKNFLHGYKINKSIGGFLPNIDNNIEMNKGKYILNKNDNIEKYLSKQSVSILGFKYIKLYNVDKDKLNKIINDNFTKRIIVSKEKSYKKTKSKRTKLNIKLENGIGRISSVAYKSRSLNKCGVYYNLKDLKKACTKKKTKIIFKGFPKTVEYILQKKSKYEGKIVNLKKDLKSIKHNKTTIIIGLGSLVIMGALCMQPKEKNICNDLPDTINNGNEIVNNDTTTEVEKLVEKAYEEKIIKEEQIAVGDIVEIEKTTVFYDSPTNKKNYGLSNKEIIEENNNVPITLFQIVEYNESYPNGRNAYTASCVGLTEDGIRDLAKIMNIDNYSIYVHFGYIGNENINSSINQGQYGWAPLNIVKENVKIKNNCFY